MDFEHECMRAELLGLPPPEKPSGDVLKTEDDTGNEVLPLEVSEVEEEKEAMKDVSGGLDELNSILSSTQKKLNRFKVVCGSFTNLLKIRIANKTDGNGSECSSRGSIASDIGETGANEDGTTAETETSQHSATVQKEKKLNLESEIGSQLSKLDGLLVKAERAEISMNSQNKEMKSFLRNSKYAVT